MIKICRYITVVFFFLVGNQTVAQYYNLTFRNHSSYSGLTQGEIESIYEDSRGFLWVGSHFGLTRYDGREFRNFYHHVDDPSSLGDNIINAIDEDSDGNLWMALYNTGFCKMNPLNSRFTNYRSEGPGTLINEKVEALIVDRKNRVWLGTEEGISIFEPGKGSFINIVQFQPGQRPVNVLCFTEDSVGNIWVGTKNDGLWMMPLESLKPLLIASFSKVNSVRSIYLRPGGKNWLATENGLYQINIEKLNTVSLTRAYFFPAEEKLEDLEVDVEGNIWIATPNNGLKIYFPKTGFLDVLKENFSSARGLLSNRLTQIFQDSRGGIWLGGENGLQYFHGPSQKFNIYPGLSNISDQVRGSTLYGIIAVDNDMIMATSGGILIYNRVTNKFIPINYFKGYDPGSIRFRSFNVEGTDCWWVCSDQGIFELTRKKGQYFLARPERLKSMPVFSKQSFRNYVKSGDGTEYWFGLTELGLLYWNPSRETIVHMQHAKQDLSSLCNNVVNLVGFDKDSTHILVGTDSGFSVLPKGTLKFKNFYPRILPGKPGLNNRYVYDFFDDGKKFWLATYGGGLNIIEKESGNIVYYTTRDGLCSDGVYTLIPEKDSVLWLGTTNGLSRFYIAGKKFENFSVEDGIPADEFNMLSRFVNTEGEIFMGTMNGLISFSPDQISRIMQAPKVYLSRIRLNGQYLSDSLISGINQNRRLVSRYGEGIYLEFSPMVYNGSANTIVRYRINEIDTAWKTGEAGLLIPLIKTEPGDYTFSVQILRTTGNEHSNIWNMQLIVTPPYWKTFSFRLLMFIVAALLSFFFLRSYTRRRLEKQRAIFDQEQAVEKERSRISAELHDDIGGGLTAIRLMSEMLKDSSTEESSRVFVNKISSSSNELVQKMNEIVWAMNINNDNLQSLISYTREFSVSYMDDFNLECKIELPDQIPDLPVIGTKRRDIFLLVKESLNNIVKHAQATEVFISVRIGENLQIEIADNGKGFDPLKIKKISNGLQNMQFRIERLHGRIQFKHHYGTRVIFEMPVKNLGDTEIKS
jgi:ligand-binding sensor domain-containing protein/signal transduction histidine kinase